MQWEDHEQYLASLTEVLRLGSAKRLIVTGDYNQIIGPESRARPELQSALQEAFPPSMTIATSGLDFEGRRSIDHIALSEDLAVESLDVISKLPRREEAVRPLRSGCRRVRPTVTIAYLCQTDALRPGLPRIGPGAWSTKQILIEHVGNSLEERFRDGVEAGILSGRFTAIFPTGYPRGAS